VGLACGHRDLIFPWSPVDVEQGIFLPGFHLAPMTFAPFLAETAVLVQRRECDNGPEEDKAGKFHFCNVRIRNAFLSGTVLENGSIDLQFSSLDIKPRKMNWRKHIFTKRRQLERIRLSKMYRRSKINCCCTIETILKPFWACGVLWSTAFNSKYLRIIVNVRDEIKRFSQRYADRTDEYSNILAINLKEVKTTRRLKRKLSQDLRNL